MSSRTKRDSIQGVHNVPTVTTQSMDTFKSSLEEGNDAIMLAGGRKKNHSKKERCKRHYPVQNNITAECWRQYFFSLYLPRDWQGLWPTTTMSTLCFEHTSALSQLIREARIRKGDLDVDGLDLVNAYGSILHPLISVALEHYHLPDQTQKIFNSFFGDIRLRFAVENKTTRWQNVEKGIVTWCTISPFLFVMGINVYTKR